MCNTTAWALFAIVLFQHFEAHLIRTQVTNHISKIGVQISVIQRIWIYCSEGSKRSFVYLSFIPGASKNACPIQKNCVESLRGVFVISEGQGDGGKDQALIAFGTIWAAAQGMQCAPVLVEGCGLMTSVWCNTEQTGLGPMNSVLIRMCFYLRHAEGQAACKPQQSY
jgi:hypothetical protein